MNHMMEVSSGPGHRTEKYIERENGGHGGNWGVGLIGVIAGALLGGALLWRRGEGIERGGFINSLPLVNPIAGGTSACCAPAAEASMTASRIATDAGFSTMAQLLLQSGLNNRDNIVADARTNFNGLAEGLKAIGAGQVMINEKLCEGFCQTNANIRERADLVLAGQNCTNSMVKDLQCEVGAVLGLVKALPCTMAKDNLLEQQTAENSALKAELFNCRNNRREDRTDTLLTAILARLPVPAAPAPI